MEINCPYCGKSHYEEGFSMRTAMYYPPIIKNGININVDRNTTTTRCKCLECNKYFNIKEQAGNTWVEKAPQPEPDSEEESEPIETTITVDNNNASSITIPADEINMETSVRPKYQWEIDIEEIKKDVQEIKNSIMELKNHVSI